MTFPVTFPKLTFDFCYSFLLNNFGGELDCFKTIDMGTNISQEGLMMSMLQNAMAYFSD